jgi:predicted porin
MQKKLIALAILGLASSAAFADVGMYGVLDGAVANLSGTGQQSQMLAVSGGLAQSRLGVKATEKLDGGLTAVAVVEYGMDGQSAAGFGTTPTARQQLLGLAGDFGTVATGYLQTTAFDFGAKFDPLADGAVSVLQSLTGAGGTNSGANNFLIGTNAIAAHAQRALAYISPSIGGVTIAVNYSTALGPIGGAAGLSNAAALGNAGAASSAVNNNNTAYLASAAYDNGPLSVSLVYASASLTNVLNVPANTATSTEYAVGASYNFGVAKVNATYQSNGQSVNSGATTTNTAYSVSAVAPVGPGAVALEYAANSIAAAGANSSSALSGTGYSLAYLQGLSKTTTAYAAYSTVTNGSAATAFGVDNNIAPAGAGGSTTLIALGLNKKF